MCISPFIGTCNCLVVRCVRRFSHIHVDISFICTQSTLWLSSRAAVGSNFALTRPSLTAFAHNRPLRWSISGVASSWLRFCKREALLFLFSMVLRSLVSDLQVDHRQYYLFSPFKIAWMFLPCFFFRLITACSCLLVYLFCFCCCCFLSAFCLLFVLFCRLSCRLFCRLFYLIFSLTCCLSTFYFVCFYRDFMPNPGQPLHVTPI